MGSISHHITPLVINDLGGGHTHTHTHAHTHTHTQAHIQTFVDRSNSKKPGAHDLWPACVWFNNLKLLIYSPGQLFF